MINQVISTIKKIKLFFFILLTSLFLILILPSTTHALENNPVPSAEQAFVLQLNKTEKNTLEAHWVIAPGTYLYQSRLQFQTPKNTPDKIHVSAFPPGENYDDIEFGKQIIYKNQLTVPLILKTTSSETTQLPLTIHYQGCAEVGFCYPPAVKNFTVRIENGKIIQVTQINHTPEPVATETTQPIQFPPITQNKTPTLFNTTNLFTLFSTCFAIGLLLCFTPCVLPMVPMLSTLIIGKQNLKTFRAFGLSSVYVLSMSTTYAAAGIIAALLGQRIQTLFQSPWILSAFAGLFVILGLELAGHINISMPDFIKSRLYQLQGKPSSGTFWGAAALGVLATLVASPCVSAPLIGVLGYITQTGNIMIGGLSLFTIGLGMGTPLVIAGTLGGKYLPKAGRWMQVINYSFAIVLFAFAIWILDRFLPPMLNLSLWAGLCLYIAYRMGSFHLKISGIMPRFGVLFLVYSGFLFLGASQGATDPLQPLAWNMPCNAPAALTFNTLSSVTALDKTLNEAKQKHQPTLVEFYADWCTSCKHMEKNTFKNPDVQTQLKNWHLVQVNVTENQTNEQALLKKFQLIGPPSVLFFDKEGNEQTNLRLTGEVSPDEFIQHLKKVTMCQEEPDQNC